MENWTFYLMEQEMLMLLNHIVKMVMRECIHRKILQKEENLKVIQKL